MTSDLIAFFEVYEREKGISRQKLIDAVSGALLTASRKLVGPARELRVDIDNQKGTVKLFASLIVVEDGQVQNAYEELALKVAKRIRKDAEIGQEVTVDVTPKDFGRIAAQTARQAIIQRIRVEEKNLIYDEFKDRAGDIISGTVRRFDKSDVIIDLGKFEATMPKKERVQTEDYAVGDRIRAYVLEVKDGSKGGSEVILSRSHPNFVRRLFESEVGELNDGTVVIRSLAREAGYRTKIAVWSPDPKVDPVGACVGLQGRRVKNIVKELNNEKVDVMRWNDDPKILVKDALKPATVLDDKIIIDSQKKVVHVRVAEDELAKAIGRNGQNVRLTNKLMGWDVQVVRDTSAHEQFEQRVINAADALAKHLETDQELALQLVKGGLNTLDVIAHGCDANDICEQTGLSVAEAEALIEKAQQKLVSRG
jgi:transcription termination/antitermination protein NusA